MRFHADKTEEPRKMASPIILFIKRQIKQQIKRI